MICINFNSLNWGNLASWLSILASIISIYIAWHIFKSWEKQKRKEVIANDSNMLLTEIIQLREDIFRQISTGNIDDNYITYISDKRDFIEFTLKQMKNESINNVKYILSITELIRELQAEGKNKNDKIRDLGYKTNELSKILTNLKYYKNM